MASFAVGCVFLLTLFSTANSFLNTPEGAFSQFKAFLDDLEPTPFNFWRRLACHVCQFLSANLKYFFVDNTTGVAVQEALHMYCKLSSDDPNEQQLCYNSLGEIWAVTYQALDVSSKDNSLCKRLTLCDYPNFPSIPLNPKLLGEFCILFVQSFQPTILANTTLPHLERIVNNFCPDFPTPEEKQKCQHFTSIELPALYQIVANLVKYPQYTCGYPSQTMKVSETSQNQPPNLGHLPQYLPGDSSCDTCKMWAQVLKPIFSNNNLLDHLTKSFHAFCASLAFPAFLKFQSNQSAVLCRSLFDNVVPMTWNLLGQELMDPEKFCVKFTLCNASQPVVDEKKITSKPHNVDVNPDLCKACKVFAEYIKSLILANATLMRVETATTNMCSTMPFSTLLKCDKEIVGFVSAFYEMVKKSFERNDTCTELISVCGSSQSGPPHAQTPVIIDEDQSTLCKKWMLSS